MSIVVVSSGGLPVTESPNGFPYYIADNGFGIPVTFVSQGGYPLVGATLPSLPQGYVFYVDLNGAYLVDSNGNFYIGPA